MAEVFVAIGLAAGIVQFLDVGTRCLFKIRSARKQAEDREYGISIIEVATRDLQKVLDSLNADEQSGQGSEDAGLQDLTTRCNIVAKDLMNALNGMKSSLEESQHKSRFRRFLEIIPESFLKDDQIESMRANLETLKQELAVHLLALIRLVTFFEPCTYRKHHPNPSSAAKTLWYFHELEVPLRCDFLFPRFTHESQAPGATVPPTARVNDDAT